MSGAGRTRRLLYVLNPTKFARANILFTSTKNALDKVPTQCLFLRFSELRRRRRRDATPPRRRLHDKVPLFFRRHRSSSSPTTSSRCWRMLELWNGRPSTVPRRSQKDKQY